MAFSDDLPPQITKGAKRRSRKRRMMKSKDLKEVISLATRNAHVARDKGFYIASPEAIQCVEILRLLRSLPLSPRLIIKTDSFRAVQFLATNGNPKIRSESRAVVSHWKAILANKKTTN